MAAADGAKGGPPSSWTEGRRSAAAGPVRADMVAVDVLRRC